MNRHDNISDELLYAFIDNELEPEDRDRLFSAINQDDALKNRACDVHEMKKMLRHAYELPQTPTNSGVRKLSGRQRFYLQGLAASLALLLFGGASGWMFSSAMASTGLPKVARLIKTIQSDTNVEEPDKIIVQASDANPVRLKAALDETENLLDHYKQAHRPLEMEIIANGGGIDLLRDGISPFERRVNAMQAKYPNLHFYACNETVAALQQTGVVVRLLPNIGLATSALDEINKRVRQGWDYVRA